MRIWRAAFGLAVAGTVASAQAAPGHRVRVLGDTMARQILTRVDPVYPAAALEHGVAGEVVLYTAVGKDGSVEQVAVVDGPTALQSAAIDAVKQWKFSPWLVNGVPVEVDTTVEVDFKPGAPGVAAPAGVAPAAVAPAASAAADSRMVAASRPAAMVAPGASSHSVGTIDWEADRRAIVLPGRSVAGTSPMAASSPLTAATPPPMAASVGPASPVVTSENAPASFVQPKVPAVVPPAVPVVKSAPLSPPISSGSLIDGAVDGPPSRLPPLSASKPRDGGLPPPSAFSEGGVSNVSSLPTGTVIANGGGTEWHLIKKVAPEYPQEAVDAGVEGVVLVSGVVKTDGRLRDLRAVSGPAELRQAAVDAAAQYVYEPILHGDELAEAKTQVPITFTLSGPAKVPAEVMAGRILNSFTPPYPPEAIKQGISGAVILHVLIGRQGQVKDVQVVSGREVLRATAVDAVKQWRYLPYKRNGVDVEVETDVEVQFTLLKQ